MAGLSILLSTRLFSQEDLAPAPEITSPGAADQYLRLRGDMLVIFGIGGFFPTYTHAFDLSDFRGMGLFPGVSVMLGLDIYWDSNFRMGAAVGFSTSKGVNENFVYFLPITFRAIYEFRAYSFSFPLGAEAGISVGSYRDLLAINPILKAKAGVFWHFSRQWSVGIDFSYWFVPQIVWTDFSKSRLGSVAEAVICGQYHF
ncbi:MAG: TP0733 family outer membrane beta-barrel protein [Spirochaetia bacterium]